jgi:hypothetical protein
MTLHFICAEIKRLHLQVCRQQKEVFTLERSGIGAPSADCCCSGCRLLCLPQSRWRSWRGRLLVGEISIGRMIQHHATRCRMNYGMPFWPIHAPLDGHRCQSSNVASRKSPTTSCALSACAAFVSSKFRRLTRQGFMDHMPSGRTSRSDCSTRPAQIAPVATRKMAAGQHRRNEELETLNRLMLGRLGYSGGPVKVARASSSFSWSMT